MCPPHDYDRRSATAPADASRAAPTPTPDMARLAGLMGNQAFGQLVARREGPAAGVVDPQLGAFLATGQRIARAGPATEAAPEAAPASAAGADKRFPIGDNVYREDQWQTALAKVVGRWHETDGITYRRIEAMKEFCGPRGAGKEATATLEDQLLEGAVLLAVGAAVAGITFALTPAVAAGAAAFAAQWALSAAAVEEAAAFVLKTSLEKSQGAAEQKVSGLLKGGGGGGTTLAGFEDILRELLSTESSTLRDVCEQQLLDLPADPPEVKWGVASALYDALEQQKEACAQIEWNVTSDLWFQLQTAERPMSFDTGIVTIDLADDLYPDDPLRVKGAYLGGEGANEDTVAAYAPRPLEDINVPRSLVMSDGNLGFGLLECGWRSRCPSAAARGSTRS